MTQLNAAQRLLVVAEGEWWDSLSDDFRKQYIEEHPDSKFAKGYQMHKQDPAAGGDTQVQRPEPAQQVPKFGPKDKETQEKLRRLPKPAQKFVQSGGTEKGSKERTEIATGFKGQSQRLARGVVKDVAGAAAGINSTYNLLNGKPQPGDFAKAGKFVANVLGASVVTAAIGASGPVGILTFLAIKHLGLPKLGQIAKSSWEDLKAPKASEAEDSDYGYWKDKDTWVSIPKEEWEKLDDDEVDKYHDEGHDPEGKFKGLEDKYPNHPRLRQAASALDRLTSSTVTSTEDEDFMKHLLDGIADYAEAGEIPDDAWNAAIAELEGQTPREGSADEQEDQQ